MLCFTLKRYCRSADEELIEIHDILQTYNEAELHDGLDGLLALGGRRLGIPARLGPGCGLWPGLPRHSVPLHNTQPYAESSS